MVDFISYKAANLVKPLDVFRRDIVQQFVDIFQKAAFTGIAVWLLVINVNV